MTGQNVNCSSKYNIEFTGIFAENISIYAIFNDQSFSDTLINDIVSFEQLGPSIFFTILYKCMTSC